MKQLRIKKKCHGYNKNYQKRANTFQIIMEYDFKVEKYHLKARENSLDTNVNSMKRKSKLKTISY